MKIAHISPSFYPALAYGGPTETVYQICRATARAGCDVRVLTTDANGRRSRERLDVSTSQEIRLEQRLSVTYCHRQAIHSVSGTLLARLPSLIRWADIVHLEAVYSFPTLPTLALATMMGKPVVWSPRGALARWTGAGHPIGKDLFEWTSRRLRGRRVVFHFTSEQEKEGSLSRYPGLEGVVIPNGVEAAALAAPVSSGDILRLLYLGRLHPIKGIENLLEACALRNREGRNPWKLTLAGAGDPEYTAALQEQIRRLGLDSQVTMAGRVDGPAKEALFQAADVVIVPSHLENFCIVVAEALVRGVPVIASRGTPWPRLESEGCGLWADNDAASLAQAIDRMTQMPLGEMGKKGRAWMMAEFSWDRVGEQMIQLYQRAGK